MPSPFVSDGKLIFILLILKFKRQGGGHHIITLYVSTQGTIFYGIIFRGNVTIWRRRGGGRNEILCDFTS